MGMLGLSPHCTVCENRTHWIELMVVDEHNQPFDNVKGELIDAEGVRHPILFKPCSYCCKQSSFRLSDVRARSDRVVKTNHAT